MSTTRLLRFKNLKERGVVTSWPMVRRWIDNEGFPPGKLLGPNTRVWTEEEINAWVASRPDWRPEPTKQDEAVA